MITWPDRPAVVGAVEAWARRLAGDHRDVCRVGLFGSYARGDWGVGSDLDLVVLVAGTEEPFEGRGVCFDTTGLPVPADLLVYTVDEWEAQQSHSFLNRLREEVEWVDVREDPEG